MLIQVLIRLRYVESGFWNFDSLFVPQQHPARDLQDTFYVSDPPRADRPRPDPENEKVMDDMELYTNKFAKTDKPKEVSMSNSRCFSIMLTLCSLETTMLTSTT